MRFDHADLAYLPDVDALAEVRDQLGVSRVLLVGDGPTAPSTTAASEVRRSDQPPGGIGSNGLYVFRTAIGWDLMAVSDGTAPAVATSVAEGTGHPLEQARRWFDFLWERATLVAPG